MIPRPVAITIGSRQRKHKPSRTICARAVLSALLVLSVLMPVAAVAAPLGSDVVDGQTAGARKVRLAALPDVDMQAGALVDAEGRVLWSRNANVERPMASITKIMTAVVAIERGGLDDMVTVPKDSTSVGESTSYLRAGEKLTLREVLEALLVKSGNDAAVAIAEHISGDESAFVDLMNAKAKQLGLTHTSYRNPHGLDEQGHHTTAGDLAVLARYAMTKPEFRRIVGLKQVTIGSGKRVETLPNTNILLGNYEGANGIKTGWTNGAGYSVVASAKRGDTELYAVVLGTRTELARFRQARELLDWGFAHYRPQQLASANTIVGEAPVTDYLDVNVPAAIAQDLSVPVLDLNGPIRREVTLAAQKAPVAQGQSVGVVTFTQDGKVIAQLPLVAVSAVKKPNVFQRIGIAIARAWRAVFGSNALAGADSVSRIIEAAVSY